MTLQSVKQIQFGVLTQTAENYTWKFSSLQPDLQTLGLWICDFVEALTNTFKIF